jgi:hypothetical protein
MDPVYGWIDGDGAGFRFAWARFLRFFLHLHFTLHFFTSVLSTAGVIFTIWEHFPTHCLHQYSHLFGIHRGGLDLRQNIRFLFVA